MLLQNNSHDGWNADFSGAKICAKFHLIYASGQMRRIENQTCKCLIFGARRGFTPRRSELKKPMLVFSKSI
jgi:hypothetical protein